MTTHAVDDIATAWLIVDWYRMRWIIEQLFRLMKSDGLRLEDSQLETAEGLMKLTAIAAKAACVVLQLVQARNGGAQPASIAFSQTEIATLEALNDRIEGKTEKQKNPHPRHNLSWASWIIARMGGWSGYPSSRPPGPITMRNGWRKIPSHRNRMGSPRCLHTVAAGRGGDAPRCAKPAQRNYTPPIGCSRRYVHALGLQTAVVGEISPRQSKSRSRKDRGLETAVTAHCPKMPCDPANFRPRGGSGPVRL